MKNRSERAKMKEIDNVARTTVLKSFRGLDKSLSHHEGREGHKDRIVERISNLEKNIFFLRALRVLRGDDHFSFLVAAVPF